MLVSHISVGGGITGLETIISTFSNIEKKLKKSKKKCAKLRYKKFIFAIVDKKPENIPGGVAYGYQNSKYGYYRFNPNCSNESDKTCLCINKKGYSLARRTISKYRKKNNIPSSRFRQI